jgi:hypothetical protein
MRASSSPRRWLTFRRLHFLNRTRIAGNVAGEATARCARRQPIGPICLAFALAGCAHTQLNSNTLDVASTIESLYREQTLTNLSRLIDDPNTIPSQVDISGGSIQTQDSITPSLNLPLGNQVMRNGTTLVVQTIQENVRALMLGVSGQWSQSWSITPVTDANALRRLRAVYRYAIGYKYYYQDNGQIDSKCNDTDPMEDEELKQNCANNELLSRYNLNKMATNNNIVIDSSRIMEPQCVVCLNNPALLAKQNTKNQEEQTILGSYLTLITNLQQTIGGNNR